MTNQNHPGPARDINLADWLDGVGFHPAHTELQQRGHEAARLLVALLAHNLHDLLPAGRDKSLVFTHLEDVLIRSNRALALGGGPRDGVPLDNLRAIIDSIKELLADREAVVPYDPRISEYEAKQRGGETLDEPILPFEYVRGVESGVMRTWEMALTGVRGPEPEFKIQVTEHDEGENATDSAESFVDDPEVLEEAAAYLLAGARQLRALKSR
jgi:hypothetical protein